MNYPENLKYTRTDEWVLLENDIATVGISDYAQHELGDIVYLELPEIGAQVSAGAMFGVVESLKTVSDLLSPVAGEVVEVNARATENPDVINTSPYGDGWLAKMKLSPASPTENSPTENLMTAAQYRAHRAG